MAKWFILWNREKRYVTQSKFMKDYYVHFEGYSYSGRNYDWNERHHKKNLLHKLKLSKAEREKYKIYLRLMTLRVCIIS